MTAPRQTGAVAQGGVALASDPGWDGSASAAPAESVGPSARKSRPPSQVAGALEVPVKTAAQLPDRRYFRIGEVATLLGVKPYVLRYWETEFPQVRPQKSRSGQRLYRRREVEQLIDIRHLLYERGFTIAGARKVLKESEEARVSGRPSAAPSSVPPPPSEPPVSLAPEPALEAAPQAEAPPVVTSPAVSVLPSLTPQSAQQLTLALGRADARLLEELRDGLKDLLSICKEA